MNSSIKLYLKQNKLNVVEIKSDGTPIVKLHGHLYLVYTDVLCSQCGAPLLAITKEEYDDECENLPSYIEWTGCSNSFCNKCIK